MPCLASSLYSGIVLGPTLVGTANKGPPASLVSDLLTPFLTMVTVYVCRKLNPAEPEPSRDVIAGGTIGVPGATGGGELPGALIPLPAPTNPVKTAGARISGSN